MARIINSPWGHVLRNANDTELFTLAGTHVDEDHPGMKRPDDEIRARVSAGAATTRR